MNVLLGVLNVEMNSSPAPGLFWSPKYRSGVAKAGKAEFEWPIVDGHAGVVLDVVKMDPVSLPEPFEELEITLRPTVGSGQRSPKWPPLDERWRIRRGRLM